MKSVKPGRGPSMMSGIVGIAVCIIGVVWTVTAISMGAPFLFPVFGVIFVIVGLVNTVYNFKNATGENRFSSFDITDDYEETDPFNDRFGRKNESPQPHTKGKYCPYCGERTQDDYKYCQNCGRELP
ncbi:MAG: zinc ribbon domain-containing protein [Clostridia bacterium]|nr:zinc ribbon domain-containing protein [Clostridia bacterium]